MRCKACNSLLGNLDIKDDGSFEELCYICRGPDEDFDAGWEMFIEYDDEIDYDND